MLRLSWGAIRISASGSSDHRRRRRVSFVCAFVFRSCEKLVCILFQTRSLFSFPFLLLARTAVNWSAVLGATVRARFNQRPFDYVCLYIGTLCVCVYTSSFDSVALYASYTFTNGRINVSSSVRKATFYVFCQPSVQRVARSTKAGPISGTSWSSMNTTCIFLRSNEICGKWKNIFFLKNKKKRGEGTRDKWYASLTATLKANTQKRGEGTRSCRFGSFNRAVLICLHPKVDLLASSSTVYTTMCVCVCVVAASVKCIRGYFSSLC